MCKQACESLIKKKKGVLRGLSLLLMMVLFLFLVENLEEWEFKVHTLGNIILSTLRGIYLYNI